MTGFAKFLEEIACGLGIPRAWDEAMALVRSSGMILSELPEVHSDVAPGAFPVEFSFSQADPQGLRLLLEPCLPGEGILARTLMGIDAVRSMAGAFSAESGQRAEALVRLLLPQCEEISYPAWRSSVWLALRTTGERSAIRVYVNLQCGDAKTRWCRIGNAFAGCGLEQSNVALDRWRHVSNLEPIGLCFDVRPFGLTPARVHCVTDKISPFWLLQLLAATGNEAAADDAADFLDLFGLLEHRGACPVLVSVGLETTGGTSVKLDVDLPNLEPDIERRRNARYLAKAEARFGRIHAYHAVRRAFEEASPRYIGLTIRPTTRCLNVYFPNASVPRGELHCTDQALEKARNFVYGEMERSGALLMDARCSSTTRAMPKDWPDLYMTCLLIQEGSPFQCLQGQALLQRARSYVREARQGWSWRYLPDLPPDLDDTAMAWAALNPTDGGIDSEVIGHIMMLANPDGGFRTFIGEGGESQPSHPAVTLNVAFALDEAHVSWPRAATDHYLENWLRQPDFPRCPWIGSPLFPIYLFARARQVLGQLGHPARERLEMRIHELRRADGTWGDELPDSLSTALAVNVLDRLGCPVSCPANVERFFLASQFDDGGWGWSPLYSDGSGTWFGHRAITTAFVIRAITILQHSM
jgi:hypothetical protein